MINYSSNPGASDSGGTPIVQLSQAQLASCPVYEPTNWAACDENDEPLYDVACYIYAIDWPNAGFADIYDVGDIYAYKQPELRKNLLNHNQSKGYLDAQLEQNALPKEQMEHFLQRVKTSGLKALSTEELKQMISLNDQIKVMAAAEKHQKGSVPHEMVSRICQDYAHVIKHCASLDGLIEITVSHQDPLASIPPRKGCYLVALSFWPDPHGPDHHWYRLDNNGLWSHKPGETKVRNVDASKQLISDPRSANLGPYIFSCFYYVPVSVLLNGIEEPVNAFDASSSEEDGYEEKHSSDHEKNSDD